MSNYCIHLPYRLLSLLAASTSVFGTILKIDSTKKVCRKLQGSGTGTASWATNVGNFSQTCVMKAFKRCISDELHGEKTVDWIQCPSCQSWYHGVCVGLAISALSADVVSEFSCCCSRFSKTSMLVWS